MLLKNLKKYSTVWVVLLLVLISLFFKSYQLESRYIFDWDQEDDAVKVSEMIQNFKPRLIGPRVANEAGFFVGPFHYYFLVPFYLITNGNPYAGAYASIFVAILTVVISFLLVKNIFNYQTAFISSLFIAINTNITSWNVMYTSVLSIFIFYLCYLYLIKKYYNLFPLIIFAYSFASTTHLVPVSLAVPVLFTFIAAKYKPNLKQLLASLVLFLIPLFPLIVFDLKHNFLNLYSIINFATSSHTSSENAPFLFLRSFWRSINILYITNPFLINLSRILIILISLYEVVFTSNKQTRNLYIVWLLTPIVLLSLYHGNIPEYYYGCINIIIIILVSKFIVSFLPKIILPIFCLILVVNQFQYFLAPLTGGITLQNKYNLVSYLVRQTNDPTFNFSYDVPLGWNNGYQYIFKYFKKEPVDSPNSHLYSVFFISDPPKIGQIVYQDNKLGLVRK